MQKNDVAYDFTLRDQDGNDRTLSAMVKDGPVVLFFYPAAMTAGCTKESCHFRDLNAEFTALAATPMPKLVVVGANDPQMDPADAVATAQRIGAPSPVYVPGRHLTMIASPRQLAAVIGAFASAP